MSDPSEGTPEEIVTVHELTSEEGKRLFDKQARRHVGMSGEEFARAWYAGEWDDRAEEPEVRHLVLLLPFHLATPTNPLRNEDDHQRAMKRIDEIFHAHPGTPEDAALDILASLVDAYEEERYPNPEGDDRS
jgi:HTH-type transcriptional regulator/antitoxin HigA